jgi:hypothetical protein
MNEEEKKLFSALKPFVHDAQKYNALIAYIDYRVSVEQRVLEDVEEPSRIYKSQGKIKALKELKRLREYVLASDKGV